MITISDRRLAPFLVLLLLLILSTGGCERADEGRRVDTASRRPAHGSGSAAPGHPAPGQAGTGDARDPHAGLAAAPVDPATLPLKETGSGSLAELERGRSGTRNAQAADCFARGFRQIFSSDVEKRNYAAGKEAFLEAIALDPNYAEAYRGLAYAEFNLGFNQPAAIENYQKAIALKPDYGEAHYALAFMYAMDDREQGAKHFKRAMELGVVDERNLATKFYPQIKIETH
jgi:tetratricopeptide (TPR) repeat protein